MKKKVELSSVDRELLRFCLEDIVERDVRLLKLCRDNLDSLIHACWLASEWQDSSADVECESAEKTRLKADARRLFKLFKHLTSLKKKCTSVRGKVMP